MRVEAQDGDTLDLLCWRELGTTAGGVVEQTLELNPGLADAGATIARGTEVTLPDTLPADAVPVLETVQLWN